MVPPGAGAATDPDVAVTAGVPAGVPGGGVQSARERTRRAVRADVAGVAFDLFVERGFEHVTVEQIAAAAGLSRSTFFRYFATKEDVVVGGLERQGALMRDALCARPARENPWRSLRVAFDVAVAANEADPARSARLSAVLAQAPTLRARLAQKQSVWQEFLVPEVGRRLGGADEVLAQVRSRALVGAALACLNTAVEVWRAQRAAGAADVRGHGLADLLDVAMSCTRGERG